MKKGWKGNHARRMMALLLSAALIYGGGGVNPVHVLAQESVSENTTEVTEEEAAEEAPEETYEEEPATEPEAGETALEDAEETVPGETMTEGQDGEAGQEQEEPVEEEAGAETAGEMDVQPDAATKQEEMTAADPAEPGTDIASGKDWTLDANGKLTIQSDAGIEDWGDFYKNFYEENVVSVEVGRAVTRIPGYSLSDCKNLKSLTILLGIKSIGDFAFCGCSSLTDIEIPTGLASIGSHAFDGCSSVTSVTLPAGVTDIGDYAFQDCSSLTDIMLWGGITNIRASAFKGCSSLSRVIMRGSTPPELGDKNVFSSCKFVADKEQGIRVPLGTVEAYKEAWADWADYIMDTSEPADDFIAFGEDWTIDSDGQLIIHSDAGMEDWWDVGRRVHKEKVISAEVRSGVTSIRGSSKNGGFTSCGNMTSISLPSSVTNIEEYAFWSCSSLTDITIPDSVTSIGASAFRGCSNLTSITLPDSVTSIGDGTFYGCSSLTSTTLPNSLTRIGKEVFRECSSLTSITIPDNVTYIDWEAFRDCSSLTSITLSDSLTGIGYGAFSYCGSLTSITFSDSLISIGGDVFLRCSSLTSLVLPDSVTDIGSEAFWGCTNLTSITLSDSLTSIGGAAFSNCALTEITIPAGVTNMWSSASRSAFSGSGLKRAVISSGATSICGGAFDGCSGLTSITIPDSVTSIEDSAFRGCSSLTSIDIPSGVTEIGYSAFYGCSSLSAIDIPSGVTEIGNGAFYECSSLSAIDIPFGVTSIGYGAFEKCSSLTSIDIPSGVTSIGEWAFQGCSSLTSIDIPSGVTEIGNGAFSRCGGLSEITIPSSVTSIGGRAFYWCYGLANVTMMGTMPPVLGVADEETGETDVFYACKFDTDGEKGIKVPWGTAEAYKVAWLEWADYITANSMPTTDMEKVFAARQAVETALPDIPVSNSTTKESLEAAIKDAIRPALTEAGVSMDEITIAVENFTRNEATIQAEGSITADIKIASGAESASVLVNKVIDRLPATPADKVASARASVETVVKRAIDKALAGTTVTNDNAQETATKIRELIPAAVAEAFAEAGISAGEVAAGEAGLETTLATADSEGSIKVTIPLTSREDAGQTASAVILVPVAKSGAEEDPGKDAETAQKLVEDALKEIKVTNDTTQEDILVTLREKLGGKAEVVGIEKFEKVDATETAAGSMVLGVRVVVNGKTMVINTTVSIPIVQIDKRPGMYVRFTDYYDMDGATPRYKYTGLAVKPAVEVYNNGARLIPDRDYTVGYKNNTKVGKEAALLVKGKGNFSGTSSVISFTIMNADIAEDTDHPTEMTVVVNTKVDPMIMSGTKKLTTKDYQLEGDGLVNGKYAAATAEGTPNTLTVKGVGSYVGSSFEMKVRVIERSAARKLSVTVDSGFRPVYSGSALDLGGLLRKTQDGEGAITVTDAKDKTKILREGTDFTVLCTSGLTSAGTVKFTVTGMGEYTGSVNKSFKIAPLKVTDSSRFSVDFDRNKAYEYRAAGTTVDGLVVKYLGETAGAEDDRILRQGTDYKVTYSNHKKVSGTKEAELKIAFLGNYKGSSAVSETFRVVPAKLSAANTAVIVPDKVYTKGNRAYKSTPIVTVDGAAIKASQYTVSYAWATESEAGDDTKYVSDDRVKITMAEGDSWAKVRVTVTPKQTGSYALAEGAVLTGEYYVRKADGAADLSRAKVTFHDREGRQHKALEYNGNPFYTPAGNNPGAENAPDEPNAVYVKVTVGGAVVDPGLYDVIWTDATEKGKATVVIRGKGVDAGKGLAVGSRNQTISIKAMVLKGRTLESILGR